MRRYTNVKVHQCINEEYESTKIQMCTNIHQVYKSLLKEEHNGAKFTKWIERSSKGT